MRSAQYSTPVLPSFVECAGHTESRRAKLRAHSDPVHPKDYPGYSASSDTASQRIQSQSGVNGTVILHSNRFQLRKRWRWWQTELTLIERDNQTKELWYYDGPRRKGLVLTQSMDNPVRIQVHVMNREVILTASKRSNRVEHAATPSTPNSQYYAVIEALTQRPMMSSDNNDEGWTAKMETLVSILKIGLYHATIREFEMDHNDEAQEVVLFCPEKRSLRLDDSSSQAEYRCMLKAQLRNIAQSPSGVDDAIETSVAGDDETLKSMVKLLQVPLFGIISSPFDDDSTAIDQDAALVVHEPVRVVDFDGSVHVTTTMTVFAMRQRFERHSHSHSHALTDGDSVHTMLSTGAKQSVTELRALFGEAAAWRHAVQRPIVQEAPVAQAALVPQVHQGAQAQVVHLACVDATQWQEAVAHLGARLVDHAPLALAAQASHVAHVAAHVDATEWVVVQDHIELGAFEDVQAADPSHVGDDLASALALAASLTRASDGQVACFASVPQDCEDAEVVVAAHVGARVDATATATAGVAEATEATEVTEDIQVAVDEATDVDMDVVHEDAQDTQDVAHLGARPIDTTDVEDVVEAAAITRVGLAIQDPSHVGDDQVSVGMQERVRRRRIPPPTTISPHFRPRSRINEASSSVPLTPRTSLPALQARQVTPTPSAMCASTKSTATSKSKSQSKMTTTSTKTKRASPPSSPLHISADYSGVAGKAIKYELLGSYQRRLYDSRARRCQLQHGATMTALTATRCAA
ncbi:hypothetical protein Poli38472_003309 [Pythium oligandrum]|uniref:Uncharacterized protein n=1 Tax=Pythium oligandrum TaxID=41045 RepID=A0A8K1C6A2_PYTOL|nr:hypothetical protein Poli38472_003309 [Pythium oligandrum]|eukprot:TMW57384.1 hypothetical protein Poli38472_003309 [Pythium oligandrum]